MFTGLITHIAKVISLDKSKVKNSFKLGIHVPDLNLSDVKLGESIALNGVCLTVVNIKNNNLCFDISPETLDKTSLGIIKTGSYLNVERALLASDRLGGHIVSGHVDCCAELIRLENKGEYLDLEFKVLDKSLMMYIAKKGSISIDGVSLTVNDVCDKTSSLSVMIIPHTQENTIIREYYLNIKVNIEVDLLARYSVRCLKY